MKNNWNFAVKELLKSEGGYTNDPSDSGGATNFGITIIDYRKYINKNGTADDVRRMTVDQAKTIYKTKYWDAINGDQLESGVDYSCFDYGVLAGLGRPRACLDKFKDLHGDKLIDAINDERTSFLTRLATNRPKDKKFLRGWLIRTERVRKQSHELAKQKDHTTPVVVAAATGGGFLYGMWHQVHAHPYITAALVIVAGLLAWDVVHYIRNKK